MAAARARISSLTAAGASANLLPFAHHAHSRLRGLRALQLPDPARANVLKVAIRAGEMDAHCH
jgi:hypothetical protein